MSSRTSTAERLPVSEPPPLPPEALVEEKEVSYEDLQHEADAYLQSLVDLENARTLNPREAGAFAPLRAEAQVALQEAKGELEGSNDDAALIAAQLTGEELEEEIAHVALNLEAVQQHIRELGAHGRSFEDREVQQLMEEETRLEALAARLTAASEAQRFLEEKFAAMRAEAEALPLHLFDERIQGAVDALESLKRTGDERSEVELLQREIAILELARDRKQREETVAAIEAKLISDDEYRAELNSPERLRAHAEKIHDRDKARVAYAEAARVFERASGKERHTATDRLATAKAEYEALNTEAVGESVKRALYERAALLDARIEEKRQEKKIGTKIYEAWKWMGEQNLEKLGWKPEGKVGKWVAKMGSLRTAVSTGLVGGSIVLGAGTAVGVGAIMLRRAFAGMGAAFGTYDLLRMADKRTAEVKGLLKVPSDEELAALSLDDLTERLNAVEARALMDGETVSHGSYREVYATLQGAYIQKAETIKERAQAEKRGSEIAAFLKERSDALEQGLDRAAKRLKSTRTRQKIVAGAVGAVVGSGLIAKGFTGLKEWLSGAESEVAPAPSAAQIETIPREAVAVIDSTTGERVGFSKEGIEYAPPPEGTPASAEAEIPAVRAALEESLYVAKKGDSVWKIATRALEERYGAEFQSLDYAQKVHLIDGIKDQILKNPDSVGLQTPHVRPGDVINFTRLFEDQKAAADLFESSKGLTPAQTDAIIKGGSPTQDWWIKKFERSWPSSDWEWPKGKLVAELNSTLAEAHEGSGGATHPDTSGFESTEADAATAPETSARPTNTAEAYAPHHEAAMGELEQGVRAMKIFSNPKLPIPERMSALKAILPTDGSAIEYNNVKFALKGDGIIFKVSSNLGYRPLTPGKIDVLSRFIKFMGDEAPNLLMSSEQELKARIATFLKDL